MNEDHECRVNKFAGSELALIFIIQGHADKDGCLLFPSLTLILTVGLGALLQSIAIH